MKILRVNNFQPDDYLWPALWKLRFRESCVSHAFDQFQQMVSASVLYFPREERVEFRDEMKRSTWSDVVGGYWWQRVKWQPSSFQVDRLGWGRPTDVDRWLRFMCDGRRDVAMSQLVLDQGRDWLRWQHGELLKHLINYIHSYLQSKKPTTDEIKIAGYAVLGQTATGTTGNDTKPPTNTILGQVVCKLMRPRPNTPTPDLDRKHTPDNKRVAQLEYDLYFLWELLLQNYVRIMIDRVLVVSHYFRGLELSSDHAVHQAVQQWATTLQQTLASVQYRYQSSMETSESNFVGSQLDRRVRHDIKKIQQDYISGTMTENMYESHSYDKQKIKLPVVDIKHPPHDGFPASAEWTWPQRTLGDTDWLEYQKVVKYINTNPPPQNVDRIIREWSHIPFPPETLRPFWDYWVYRQEKLNATPTDSDCAIVWAQTLWLAELGMVY
jgi:hypothetical protein